MFKPNQFIISGHRGARGLMPENTIRGMIHAIQNGATILEMDLQFTNDGFIVVAHDPFINRNYSLDKDGLEISEHLEKKLVLYNMSLSKIITYDVGLTANVNFPEQQNYTARIPELGTLIDHIEKFTFLNNLDPILYNLEIKASPDTDAFFHPKPQQLIQQLLKLLESKNINNRYYISSFDSRQIIEVKNQNSTVFTAFLTESDVMFNTNCIENLGFKPEIISPHFTQVSKKMVLKIQQLGIKVIPWTVNEEVLMRQLIKMGVDGIITDYPNRLKKISSTITN